MFDLKRFFEKDLSMMGSVLVLPKRFQTEEKKYTRRATGQSIQLSRCSRSATVAVSVAVGVAVSLGPTTTH